MSLADSDTLRPLLEGFLNGHPDWSIHHVTPGAPLRALLKSSDARLEIWLAPISSPEPCYRRTTFFRIGHKDSLAPALVTVMDAVCASILQGEQQVTPDQVSRLLDPRGPTTLLGADLELRITSRCNEACPFCSARGWAANRVTSSEQILTTMGEARRRGAKRVVFTGGEPTLVDDLPAFIQHGRHLGFGVVLQTNGLVPSSLDWWYRLIRCPGGSALPDSIFLSLHSQHANRMQRQTGVPLTLHKKLAAVRNAHRMGVGVAINFVLTQLNIDEVHDFPRFVAARLGRYPELVLSVAAPVGAMEKAAPLQLSVPQLAPQLRRALLTARRAGLRTQVAEACGVPMCVVPDQADLFAAFHRTAPVAALAADRVKGPDCSRCTYDSRCIGIWRSYAETFGISEFNPI